MRPYLSCLLLLIACLSLTACGSEPPVDKKTRILNLLQNMESNIEAKALDDFMDHVSEDFKLTNRGYQKKDAERMLRIKLMQNKNIHVHQVVKSIEWPNNDDQIAEVEVVAAMAGSDFSLSDMPSFRGDMAKFKVTIKMVDGAYQITGTTWERALPTDFVL